MKYTKNRSKSPHFTVPKLRWVEKMKEVYGKVQLFSQKKYIRLGKTTQKKEVLCVCWAWTVYRFKERRAWRMESIVKNEPLFCFMLPYILHLIGNKKKIWLTLIFWCFIVK